MSEPKTYSIRTVSDFLALPPEKIAACLTDFEAWLQLVHGALAVIKAQPESIRMNTATDVFPWIDDGKHIATLTVQHGELVVAREEFEFAPPE